MNDTITKAVPPVFLRSGALTATLYLGDCRILAPMLDGVDAVISDPPYGMDWDTDSTRFSGGESANIKLKPRGEGRDDWGGVVGDVEPFDPSPWLDYERCVLFGANHYAQRLPVGTILIWLKRADHLFQSFLSDAEIVWMKGGHGVYAFRKQFPPPLRMKEYNGGAARPAHPTQKPIDEVRDPAT